MKILFFLRNAWLATLVFAAMNTVVPAEASPEQDFKTLQQSVLKKGASAEDMRKFADCLAKGIGTKPDIFRAATWYANAADRGDKQALEKLRQWSRSRMKKKLPSPVSRPNNVSEAKSKAETIRLHKYLTEQHTKVGSQTYTRKARKMKASSQTILNFLKNGADPNLGILPEEVSPKNKGAPETATELALKFSDYETLTLLIANGGDLNLGKRHLLRNAIENVNFAYEGLLDAKEKKPVMQRDQNGDMVINTKINHTQWIKRAQERFDNALTKLEFMLRHGCDPRIRSDMGITMLSHAHCLPAINLLLKYGADINQRNEPGDNSTGDPGWADQERGNPLFRIISSNSIMGAKAIIDAGIDINFRNDVGKTPLDIAIQNTRNRSEKGGKLHDEAKEIEQILLRAGAKRGNAQ